MSISATQENSHVHQFRAEPEAIPPVEERPQWIDKNPNEFTRAQREHTTILVAGLTHAHDVFLRSAIESGGYKVEILDCPDNQALRYGKEFGNRGQCNPTYFTVGNLVKFLTHLRDDEGMDTREIVEKYIFLTAGACGPCRFGMYATEYRKALRDAGFEGFRVILISQSGAIQSETGRGFNPDNLLIARMFRAVIIGDVLNALMYRIRPYEVVPGATDAAITECREVICTALSKKKSLFVAAWRCRKILSKIEVDRTRIKPRVAIIGEFWAMTTEGDGNYKLQRFLEGEGAEVDIQLVSAWLLYLLWESRYDTKRRMELKATDQDRNGLHGVNVRGKLLGLWVAEKVLKFFFYSYAKIMGLKDYHLPDQNEVAEIAHRHYDNHLRGGEGHMEIGKVIQNVVHNKVNMTISVKPFGCMPSSGVSDGVQSLITELHPQAIFLPIETSGDAAVNVYSRIQMQLFKARQRAAQEVEEVASAHGLTVDALHEKLAADPRARRALHRSPHTAGCTAADLARELSR
ncbi:MAG: 2-hydroxyglutaryl-CoA dehydratase [Chrysiogenetes bacterium]|nr:2-hydroxyglutaryl-CoA dehydratase [Chrysiogenetes bacterium]